jgi:hypothetical protein
LSIKKSSHAAMELHEPKEFVPALVDQCAGFAALPFDVTVQSERASGG